MSRSPVQAGDILAGKYRVERVLGAGGMGVVVAATHLELLEPRALKFMLPTALDNAEAVERFLREARAAARLKSEHVAKVHDVGRLENGAPYMVMEYLQGADLNELVKQRGSLPIAEVALYIIQTCEALAEAHTAGIVHRDLKPANLFLTYRPDGTPCVKVLDFGISKFTGSGQQGPEFEMTKTHAMLGSPYYMSPEQMRSARDVDPRSDIWALGVILYKLITGSLPFQADTLTALVTIVVTTAAPPPSRLRPELPPALDKVILTCLQREREARYPTVADLAAALLPFAPAGVAPVVERIERLFAASPTHARPRLPSAATIPSSTGSGQTVAAWGQTSSEGKSRSRAPLLLAIIASITTLTALLGLGLGISRLGDPAPSNVPAASIEASTDPQTAELPAPKPPPESISKPTASASASSEPAPVAPSASTKQALPSALKPRVTAPKATSSDPFGTGRK